MRPKTCRSWGWMYRRCATRHWFNKVFGTECLVRKIFEYVWNMWPKHKAKRLNAFKRLQARWRYLHIGLDAATLVKTHLYMFCSCIITNRISTKHKTQKQDSIKILNIQQTFEYMLNSYNNFLVNLTLIYLNALTTHQKRRWHEHHFLNARLSNAASKRTYLLGSSVYI